MCDEKHRKKEANRILEKVEKLFPLFNLGYEANCFKNDCFK